MNKDLWEKINYLKRQEQALNQATPAPIPTLTETVAPAPREQDRAAPDTAALEAALVLAVEEVLNEARANLNARVRQILAEQGIAPAGTLPLAQDDQNPV